ncbi:MAG TPA: glutathione peroxidase [Clostridiales bacterium]|nr:MAG: Hydroperoxy fatty acid reductase gpx1 [Firmicutes bacterium ADurb.Bin262]HOU09790.1 glutathione peroxidase [Clostridiales bacterium]HQH63760.1 glutathione peroxidase [Clostridiales bacterium]HQK74107.1 glutathione peroxidase [Clostridiales bacterium]
MSIYDFTVKDTYGDDVSLSDYKGKVLLIVNTASKCGFTPQFEGLEKLYKELSPRGLEILGFPCNQFANQDPGTDEEIRNFCQFNYGVSFPIFAKIDVNGPNAAPLYQFLKNEKSGIGGKKIKWNFTKFLVDKDGTVLKRYASATTPEAIRDDIVELLD